MELMVISSANRSKTEVTEVVKLFQNGLQYFHLRKPKFKTAELEEYLTMIPEHYHDRIILHTKHQLLSKFNLAGIHIDSKLEKQPLKRWFKLYLLKRYKSDFIITTTFKDSQSIIKSKYNYHHILLRPLFDRVSSKRIIKGIPKEEIIHVTKKSKQKIVGYGGVELNKIHEVLDLGMFGLGITGALWEKAKSPLQIYKEFIQIAEHKDLEHLNIKKITHHSTDNN